MLSRWGCLAMTKAIITSIDGVGTLAARRSDLEQGKQGACFGLDVTMVSHTPFEHFVGVDADLFDAARIDAVCAQGCESLLDELKIGIGDVRRSTDFEETRIVLWPRPDNGDDFVHWYLLSVVSAQPTVADAGVVSSRLGGGLPA
jgi:hypothetical protein